MKMNENGVRFSLRYVGVAAQWMRHMVAIFLCRREMEYLNRRGYALSSQEMTALGLIVSLHSAGLERLRTPGLAEPPASFTLTNLRNCD